MVLHSRKNVAVSSCATNLRGWTPCPLKSFRHGTQRVGKRKDLSCWSDQPTKSGLFWITVMIFLEFQISSWYLLIFGFYTIDSKGFVCRYLLLKLCWFGLSWRNVISVWWNVLAYSPLRWHYSLHAFWSGTTFCPRRPISSLGLITHDSSLLSSTSSWAFWRPSFWRQKS